MQTILGAGGTIGRELAQELPAYTDQIRLVSRHPIATQPGQEWMQADLGDRAQVMAAVAGSETVYLTVGLPYDHKIWQQRWPVIMTNAIAACQQHQARLVFFDNVYIYGKVDGWMTETTPFNPCSRKGEVRAQIATQLLEAIQTGGLTALIARSADFYGPHATNSIPNRMVFDPLKAGKPANWLSNDQVRHSFTFTPDAARATALLGNTAGAYGQTWHLPTDPDALTGKAFIEQCARAFGVLPRYSVLKNWMITLAGLFDTTVREVKEMDYQQQYEYLFDSHKFENRFFKATAYAIGIQETVKSLMSDRTLPQHLQEV